MNTTINRRRFIGAFLAASAVAAVSTPAYGETAENKHLPDVSDVRQEKETLRIAVFDVDATPPLGSLLAYDPVIRTYDLGLRAKGIV
ncbi:MAG: hypothetical protein LBS42_05480, partial [Tannerella sp.]|nr:hypothetical protein [Tannerella sp.]